MYITVKEAAKKWGISDRRVRDLCSEGKIPGVYKEGRAWKIPQGAEKPSDGRYKNIESIMSIIEEKLELIKKKKAFNRRRIRKVKGRIFNRIYL